MTDIVQRLRSRHWQHQGDAAHWSLRDEAANEIERLRAELAGEIKIAQDAGFVEASRLHGAEIERLRAALREVLDAPPSGVVDHYEIERRARAALGE